MSNRKIKFRHHVRDKDGHIEMELFYNENSKWSVHYPHYEMSETHLRSNTCFTEFYTYQVAMLIFAYSEDEFKRFERGFRDFQRKKVDIEND